MYYRHYLISVYPEPPYEVYRHTVSTDVDPVVDEIVRMDADSGSWVDADTELVRRQVLRLDPGLRQVSDPFDDDEALEWAERGWDAERFAGRGRRLRERYSD